MTISKTNSNFAALKARFHTHVYASDLGVAHEWGADLSQDEERTLIRLAQDGGMRQCIARACRKPPPWICWPQTRAGRSLGMGQQKC